MDLEKTIKEEAKIFAEKHGLNSKEAELAMKHGSSLRLQQSNTRKLKEEKLVEEVWYILSELSSLSKEVVPYDSIEEKRRKENGRVLLKELYNLIDKVHMSDLVGRDLLTDYMSDELQIFLDEFGIDNLD